MKNRGGVFGVLAVVLAVLFSPACLAVGGPMDAVFAAVDLTAVSAFVGGAMLVVVAIALAFKAGVLGKRTIKAV